MFFRYGRRSVSSSGPPERDETIREILYGRVRTRGRINRCLVVVPLDGKSDGRRVAAQSNLSPAPRCHVLCQLSGDGLYTRPRREPALHIIRLRRRRSFKTFSQLFLDFAVFLRLLSLPSHVVRATIRERPSEASRKVTAGVLSRLWYVSAFPNRTPRLTSRRSPSPAVHTPRQFT